MDRPRALEKRAALRSAGIAQCTCKVSTSGGPKRSIAAAFIVAGSTGARTTFVASCSMGVSDHLQRRRARRRREQPVELRQLFGVERDGQRAQIFLQAPAIGALRDDDDVVVP